MAHDGGYIDPSAVLRDDPGGNAQSETGALLLCGEERL